MYRSTFLSAKSLSQPSIAWRSIKPSSTTFNRKNRMHFFSSEYDNFLNSSFSRKSKPSLRSLNLRRAMATQSNDNTEKPDKKAWLVLEDGTRLQGYSFGAEISSTGEVVFSTGMVGYTESLTDPSYCKQMLTITHPMVGNYGVPDRNVLDKYGLPAGFESYKIHAAGLVVQDYSHHYSHWNAKSSLSDWLKEQNIPAIGGIDTRLLTKKIRSRGSMPARIEIEGVQVHDEKFLDPNTLNLVAEVSVSGNKKPKIYGKGNPTKILAVDCGIKYNIIRHLVEKGAEVHVVPWNHPISEMMSSNKFDGLFLSNGPGDPTMCESTINELKAI